MADTDKLVKVGQLDAVADAVIEVVSDTNERLERLEEGEISGSGMNDAAIYYLQKVLESALFSTDASADIQTLVDALKGQGGIVQDGETLTVNYLLNDTATASAGYVTIT